MTTDNPNPEHDATGSTHPRENCPTRSRRTRVAIGAAALLLTGAMIGGAITVAAGASAHVRFGAESGDGGGRMARHFERKLERVLAEVDATDEQRDQAEDVVAAFVADLAPLKTEHREQRKELMAAILAEDIDVARIESLRTEVVDTADRVSREVAESLTALAQVFEPEQRAEMLQMAERFGGRHGRRHKH